MKELFVISVIIFLGVVIQECGGNLSPIKTSQQKKHLRNRDSFEKKGKKQDAEDEEVTLAPPLKFTTVSTLLQSTPQPAPEQDGSKTQRIIEVTALICGIAVVFMITVLSIRLSCTIYDKYGCSFKPRRREENNPPTEEPIVRYTSGAGSSTSSGATASIYTVMPGHFVLQPCYTNAPTATPPSQGIPPTASSSSAGVHHHRHIQPGEAVQVVACIRPETPPPPYPGFLK